MNILETKIPDLKIIEPKVYSDSRGWFVETWQSERYEKALGCSKFVQDNMSCSKKGTLRGLHIQTPRQGKLVQVIQGEVFDVAVDLRHGSKTFGLYESMYLSETNKRQFWIPEGFAHGFYVTSETAVLSYKCTEYYNPKGDKTLAWDDPDINIAWPCCLDGVKANPLTAPCLSDKDSQGLRLKELTWSL